MWEGAEGGDIPSVLELAGWMARDDGWLPKAEEAGSSLKKGPSAAELVEQVWALLPVGLQRWCLEYEADMWAKPYYPLSVLEGIIGRVSASFVRDRGLGEEDSGGGGDASPWCDHEGLGIGETSPGGGGGTYYGYKSGVWLDLVVEEMVALGLRRVIGLLGGCMLRER